MINEKKIISEAINHFIEWSEFNKKTQEEIDMSLQLYIGQNQYDGLFKISIDKNLNLSEQKIKYRKQIEKFLYDLDKYLCETEVLNNMSVRCYNALRQMDGTFFGKSIDYMKLVDLVDVFDKNLRTTTWANKSRPLYDDMLRYKNVGIKTVNQIKECIEKTYKVDLDEYFKKIK